MIKILKAMIPCALLIILTSCTETGKYPSQVSADQIADNSIELSKLKTSTSESGKVITTENGIPVWKTPSSTNNTKRFVVTNSNGDIVLERAILSNITWVSPDGHDYGSIDIGTGEFNVAATTNVFALTESGSAGVFCAHLTTDCSDSCVLLPISNSNTLSPGTKMYMKGSDNYYELDGTEPIQGSYNYSAKFLYGSCTVESGSRSNSITPKTLLSNPISQLGAGLKVEYK